MKEADVSVALLNGFGTESDKTAGDARDTEDERRKERLQRRGMTGNKRSSSDHAAAAARIQQRLEADQKRITLRAARRNGMNETTSEPIPYSLSDLKDMLSSALDAAMDERRRAKKLREGGGEAATLLVEDEIQRNNGTATSIVEVRPGEACMASPFSCLRSSIDGVEAV